MKTPEGSVDDIFARPVCEQFEKDTGIKVKLVPDTEETKSTGLLNRLRPDVGDLVEQQHVGYLIHQIADVVQRSGQIVDVLTIDRGDEARVQQLDDLMGDLVTDVLPILDLGDQRETVGIVLKKFQQQLRRRNQIARRPVEQCVELPVLRNQPESGHRPSLPKAAAA